MKRLVALVFSVLFLFVSCNSKEFGSSAITVMEYEGEKMSSGLFGFAFSYNKTNYLYMLGSYDGADYVQDTEAFWSTMAEDGVTFGESVTQDIIDHCKMVLIASDMSVDYGVSLTEDDIETAENELNELIASFGSEKKFNKHLEKFGIDADDVLEYLKKKYLIIALQNKLSINDGLCEVSSSDITDYVEEKYIKVRHIYFDNSKHNDKAYEELSAICEQLNSGEKKLDDVAKLSEDTFIESNPNGVLTEKATLHNDYLESAEMLEKGKYGVVKISSGAYLIEKLEISDDDIEENFDAFYSAVSDIKFSALISTYYDGVEVNGDEIKKYDIVTAETYNLD